VGFSFLPKLHMRVPFTIAPSQKINLLLEVEYCVELYIALSSSCFTYSFFLLRQAIKMVSIKTMEELGYGYGEHKLSCEEFQKIEEILTRAEVK
jgi:hypothetical protein